MEVSCLAGDWPSFSLVWLGQVYLMLPGPDQEDHTYLIEQEKAKPPPPPDIQYLEGAITLEQYEDLMFPGEWKAGREGGMEGGGDSQSLLLHRHTHQWPGAGSKLPVKRGIATGRCCLCGEGGLTVCLAAVCALFCALPPPPCLIIQTRSRSGTTRRWTTRSLVTPTPASSALNSEPSSSAWSVRTVSAARASVSSSSTARTRTPTSSSITASACTMASPTPSACPRCPRSRAMWPSPSLACGTHSSRVEDGARAP